MASSAFNFSDFSSFADLDEANEFTYSIVADSVVDYLKEVYGIYVNLETLTYEMYVSSTTFSIPIMPIINVSSITYGGVAQTFTYKNKVVTLPAELEDYDIPLVITLDVGFSLVPSNLKLAAYRHMVANYFSIIRNTDNISKSINSEGNTAFYREVDVPKQSISTYQFYTPVPLVSYDD